MEMLDGLAGALVHDSRQQHMKSGETVCVSAWVMKIWHDNIKVLYTH